MAEKIYVVTLKKREDLDGFYSDMETNGFRLNLKRPISRNTHYWMTEDQANTLTFFLHNDQSPKTLEQYLNKQPQDWSLIDTF